jgi:hypothetical protein
MDNYKFPKIKNLSDDNFKIRIIDFYKDVDKPLITNLYNDDDGKDLLKISLKNEVSILKKDKKKWQIKDKRKLLKEIDMAKKKKVKEITNNFNNITKPNQTINILKDTNNKLISELESIDNFKKNIENDNIYDRLKNLASLSYNNNDLTKKNIKGGGKNKILNIKIVDIVNKLDESSSIDSDFIEIFSN